MSAEDLFNKFWNSGLHGADWPKKETFCICQYTIKDENGTETMHVIKEQNQPGKHVEVVVFDKLKEVKPICIRIYLNWSPCYDCCRAICQYKNAHSSCTLQIKFSSLYYINKPESLCPKNCKSCNEVDTDKHRNNLKGLGMLLNQDIQLNPICSLDTWIALKIILDFDLHDVDLHGIESKYEHIYDLIIRKENERQKISWSRKMEDEIQKKALETLKDLAKSLANITVTEDAGATGGADDDITERMKRTSLTGT